MNPILARLAQHIEGERRGEWMGRTVPRIAQPITAVANAIGLAQEPFNKFAETATGEGLLLQALAQYAMAEPGSADSQQADAMLRAGPLHPGRVLQMAQQGQNAEMRGTALGGSLVLNPLNLLGGLGAVSKSLELQAPLVSRALKAAALTGEGVNRASVLPLYLATAKARKALFAAPDWLEQAAQVAPKAAPAVADLLETATARQAAKEATDVSVTPLRTKLGGVPQNQLPKIGGKRQYAPALPPEIPLPPASAPPRPITPKLANRVAAAMGERAPVSEFVPPPPPARAPLPLPRSRDQRIASALAQRFGAPARVPATAGGEAAGEVAQVVQSPAAVRALPTRRAPDLGNLIAGRFGLPQGAVTRAEERAAGELAPLSDELAAVPAPDFPAAPGGLGGLASDEIDTLVRVAYPGDTAAANAIKAHPDPAELAQAALSRIRGNNRLLANLSQADDALARKLAYLPEPGEAVDELSNVDIPAVGGREAFDQLVASRDNGLMGEYLPSADFFAKRLGIPIEEAQGYIDDLVAQGAVGDAMGSLAFKPGPKNVDIPRGGDLAAGGGGGLGILPYPGGLSGPVARAVERGALGGIAGTAIGAGAGAAGDEDDRVGGALRGALYGAGAGFGAGVGTVAAPGVLNVVRQSGPQLRRALDKVAPPGFLLNDDILADVVTAVQRARDEAGQTVQPGGLAGFWQKLAGQWSRMTVDTAKQIPQDALYRSTVVEGVARKEFPGLTYDYIRQFHGPVSRERATGAVSMDDPYNIILLMTGHADKIARKGDIIGTEFTDAVTGKARFGRVGSAAAGAALSLGAAVKTVNPLALIGGGLRGALDLEWSTALRHLIGTANDAFREALGTLATQRELAQVSSAFLDDLAARGVDVTRLRARDGMFTGTEVAAIAGKQAGDDWHALSAGAIYRAGDRVAFLAGDFRDKLSKDYLSPERVSAGERRLAQGERAVGKVAPFSRWQIRSAPVFAEIARRHPRAVALVTAANVAAIEAAADDKLKGYQIGTIPISTETPGVGALARARLGGNTGVARINPLGAFVPYGPELVAAGDTPEDATAYQRATDLAGRVGFMPNPVVQSVAYVTGQDYKAPGALSRTAGLEGLADLGPIALRAGLRATGRADLADQVPDLAIPSGRALLDAGRELLSPVTGAHAVESDPAVRRYAELVMAETHLPLSDPENRHYAAAVGDPNEPLWERAVWESRLQGAAGNATGMISPIPTTGQTSEAVAAQQAGKLPWTAYEISQMTPAAARAALLENQRYAAQHPEAETYVDISRAARLRRLMAAFEAENARTKRLAPSIYQQRKKAYADYLESLP